MVIDIGMKIHLMGTKAGTQSIFETEILSVDRARGMFFVHYTEDAKALHSQRNFSIVPKFPIPINIIAPSFESSYETMQVKILEMSRIKLIVFSEEDIPENFCLSVNFSLPNGQMITSPLCIARKRQEKFMYDIDLVEIDEKERSKIILYMYKCQIEMINPELR